MRIEVNPQNSQKFEPTKFSCYTVAITGVSLFQSYKKCLIRGMFFPLSNLPRHSVTEREVSELSNVHIRVLYDCLHHEKRLVPSFCNVSIDHLFLKLESEKRNYCFGKKSGKSLEFWIQKSVPALHTSMVVGKQLFLRLCFLHRKKGNISLLTT